MLSVKIIYIIIHLLKTLMNVLLPNCTTATAQPAVSTFSEATNVNAMKVTEIPGWTLSIGLEDIVNNVPHNIVIIEENANIKMDKKFACKYINFYFFIILFIFISLIDVLEIIMVPNANSMERFWELQLEPVLPQ